MKPTTIAGALSVALAATAPAVAADKAAPVKGATALNYVCPEKTFMGEPSTAAGLLISIEGGQAWKKLTPGDMSLHLSDACASTQAAYSGSTDLKQKVFRSPNGQEGSWERVDFEKDSKTHMRDSKIPVTELRNGIPVTVYKSLRTEGAMTAELVGIQFNMAAMKETAPDGRLSYNITGVRYHVVGQIRERASSTHPKI